MTDLEKTKAWHAMVLRAWTDSTFRNQLLSDPQAILESAGLINPGEKVSIATETPGTHQLVLPDPPAGLDPKQLTIPQTDDLAQYFEQLPKVFMRGPGSRPCGIPGGCSWMS